MAPLAPPAPPAPLFPYHHFIPTNMMYENTYHNSRKCPQFLSEV